MCLVILGQMGILDSQDHKDHPGSLGQQELMAHQDQMVISDLLVMLVKKDSQVNQVQWVIKEK